MDDIIYKLEQADLYIEWSLSELYMYNYQSLFTYIKNMENILQQQRISNQFCLHKNSLGVVGY